MKPDPLSFLLALGGPMPFFGNDSKLNIFAMGQRPINHAKPLLGGGSARPLKTHRHCKRTRSKR